MEKIPFLPRAINGSSVIPTIEAFTPDLQANASAILSYPRETFQYGEHPRQKLDVYTPKAGSPPELGKAAPIVVFFYGGGLMRGERIESDVPGGLVHTNKGYFFASRGYITIIADWRLIPHGAKFPSGGEDIAALISWTQRHFGNEPRDLFLWAHSGGTLQIATFIFLPEFKSARHAASEHNSTGVRLRGVILLGMPAHFRNAPEFRKESHQAFYGTKRDECSPLALLQAVPKPTKDVPPALLMYGDFDCEDEIVKPNQDFVDEWRRSMDVPLTVKIIRGHNHLSPLYSLGTGKKDQESWGESMVEWMQGVSKATGDVS